MKIRKYKIIVLFTMLLLTSTFIVGIYLLAGEVKNGLDKEEIENNSITYENLEEIINSYSLEGLKKELVEVEAAKGREIDISGMSIVLPDGWSEKQSKRFEYRGFTKSFGNNKYKIIISYNQSIKITQGEFVKFNSLLDQFALSVDGRILVFNVDKVSGNGFTNPYNLPGSTLHLIRNVIQSDYEYEFELYPTDLENAIPTKSGTGQYSISLIFPVLSSSEEQYDIEAVKEMVSILKSISWGN